MPDYCYDLVVVGGGINGAGIARDAAGRNLSVLLVEQDDLAAHTSSASSKLIHGGLRYLEHGEFGLVRKALAEREVLLNAAPHIVQPLRFVMPHAAGQRPAWQVRAGLFLYDHLARRDRLPASYTVDLRQHPAGAALKPEHRRGFVYSDACVQDARLVVLSAVDARLCGARIATRTALVAARRGPHSWTLELRDTGSGRTYTVRTRVLVNAAGPWVQALLQGVLGVESAHRVRLVKGSHIAVPRLYDHPDAYLFQNPDGRVLFALPFEEFFTLLGTTEVEETGDPAQAAITPQEIDYLCAMASRYFAQPVTAADVRWSFAGVRPLLDDAASNASRVTRDYALELDRHGAPVLSVFGGKLTTYRKLAEQAVDQLMPLLGKAAGPWTAGAQLPGGDIENADCEAYVRHLRGRYDWLPQRLARRLAYSYGTRSERILGNARNPASLGEPVLPDLYACELAYLVAEEFARTPQDILWRRTKLGLVAPRDAEARLQAWLDGAMPTLAPAAAHVAAGP
jgi:glycerol-3-phosphate dehydrogenase